MAADAGFFKVRGININHVEFQNLMFDQDGVAEFKLELLNEGGPDILALSMETASGTSETARLDEISKLIKKVFEVTPKITILARGTLGQECEENIKTNRFYDRRND